MPRVRKAHTTVAHSPQIKKPQKHIEIDKPPSPPRVIKAQPYMEPKPFKPKIEHRYIKPADFKLPGQELSERKRLQLEEQRRKEAEHLEAQRRFKANPMVVEVVEVMQRGFRCNHSV